MSNPFIANNAAYVKVDTARVIAACDKIFQRISDYRKQRKIEEEIEIKETASKIRAGQIKLPLIHRIALWFSLDGLKTMSDYKIVSLFFSAKGERVSFEFEYGRESPSKVAFEKSKIFCEEIKKCAEASLDNYIFLSNLATSVIEL